MPPTPATAALASQPDPSATPVHIAHILGILGILLRYALGLTKTLDRLATLPGFSILAHGFGTTNLPLIVASVRRGTRRLLALQRVLRARAAAGRDIRPSLPQPSRPPARPAPTAGTCPVDRRPPAPREPSDPLAVASPEQYEADARRRPVGRVLADICRDLGISPSLCDPLFWNATFEAMWYFRGSFGRYARDMRQRARRLEYEADHRLDLDCPDMSKASVRRTLGALIGEGAIAPHPVPPPARPNRPGPPPPPPVLPPPAGPAPEADPLPNSAAVAVPRCAAATGPP